MTIALHTVSTNEAIDALGVSFIAQVKKGSETFELEKELSQLDLSDLEKLSEGQKKAFWINIYNAWFLILRKRVGLEKPIIYTKKALNVTDLNFSLDDIEHGILRKNKFKYSLGFVFNPFANSALKKLAVKELDFRIHFALNCGAISCPPIAIYTAESVNAQLENATQAFLENETKIDNKQKVVYVSTLFKWYFADFGWKKGIIRLLEKYLKVQLNDYKVVFAQYNWTEKLDNFT